MHDDDDSKPPAAAEIPAGGPAMATKAVDCCHLVSLLGDYVDGHLQQETAAAVDGHIGQCAPCLAFLRQYRFAPEAVRRHLLECVPVDLENRLLSFLRARTKRD